MKKILPYIFIIGVLLSLFSCDFGNSRNTERILPEKLMKDILIDLHVSEAITGRRGGLTVHREMFREDLTAEIFEKYDIPKETFFRSYQYYLEHPIKLDSMYAQIIRVLEEKSESEKDSELDASKKIQNPSTDKGNSSDQSPPIEE